MRLRVIAGSLGGRLFEAPTGFTTHPMGDRIRTALFNKLGDISGLKVFDPFAGSGAIGIEAVSRGAESVLAIERDRKAQKIIENNLKTLNIGGKIRLVKANSSSWSDNNPDVKFDLIIADPPYNEPQESTIVKLSRHLTPGGTMVLSHAGKMQAPEIGGLIIVDTRNYGDASLAFYNHLL